MKINLAQKIEKHPILDDVNAGHAFSPVQYNYEYGETPQYVKLESCYWTRIDRPDHCACLNSLGGNLCFIPKNELVIDFGPVKSVEF